MLPEEDESGGRPRAVTVIGWLWVIVALFSIAKALVNLVVWKVLEPAAPSLFGDVAARAPQIPFLRPLLAHLTLVVSAQALWWTAVGVAAFGLLRLRPWARVTIQGVCWALLAYVAAFAAFWATVWPRLPARGAFSASSATSFRAGEFVGGFVALVIVGAALITMIVLLRSSRVREAFARSPAKFPMTG